MEKGSTVRPFWNADFQRVTETLIGRKAVGCGVDHPSTSSFEVKERVELHLYSLWACYRINFYVLYM
jgi:hypothetical protein